MDVRAQAATLCDLAREGAAAEIIVYLKNGADPNCTDHNASTPLHLAAAAGMRKTAEVLLSRGARLELTDRWGATPAACAEREGHHSLLDLLR